MRARRRRAGVLRRALVAAVGGALAAASLTVAAGLVAPDPSPSPEDPGPAAASPVASAPVALDPRTFGPGGCLALPAGTSPPRATVMLDAGHGGPDPGSLGTTPDGRTVEEKDLNLSVVLEVAARLRDRGVTVVLSRSNDDLGGTIGRGDVRGGALTTAASQDDLLGRVRCANLARADALVSVHFNSFDDPAVTGSETLYDVDRPFAPDSRALAQSLHSRIRTALAALGRPSPDRGVIDDSAGSESGGGDIVLLGPRVPGHVDEPSAMPGALVEPLFVTNPGDLAAVDSPAGVAALGEAVAVGIEEYLAGTRRR